MIDLSQITLRLGASAHQALLAVNQGCVQIALVVDANSCLVGTLTDGDIRRGLLNGISLDAPVEQFMNRNYKAIQSSEDSQSALRMMRKQSLLQIPVLDNKGRPIQLLTLQDLLKSNALPNSVVIMAGGKGMRLRPHTEYCPKPMLLIDDQPMLEILLRQCIDAGLSKFYFSVNYLKEQIIDYFKDGSKWGVSIKYLIEDHPLGTAGSLQLFSKTPNESFLVMNGDVLTRFNPAHLLQFHHEHQAQATLCVREHELSVPFGVVQTEGIKLSGFQEKPNFRYLVNAGLYIIEPMLLSLLPIGEATDMPTLLLAAQQAGHLVAVCPIHEYWLDVGRPESLQQAHQEWPDQARS